MTSNGDHVTVPARAVGSVGVSGPATAVQDHTFRAGLVTGTLLAVVAALPAALRVRDETSFALAFLGLWGAAAMVLGPCAGFVRRARPLQNAAIPVLLGVLIAVGPVAFLARTLKATTHHRPLGAVTFAIVAGALLLGAVAFLARLVTEARRVPSRSRPLMGLAFLGLVVTALLVTLAFGLSTLGADSAAAGLRGSVVDALLFGICLWVAAWVPVPGQILLRSKVAGPVLWVLAAMCATVLLRRADLASAVTTKAPLFGAFAGL